MLISRTKASSAKLCILLLLGTGFVTPASASQLTRALVKTSVRGPVRTVYRNLFTQSSWKSGNYHWRRAKWPTVAAFSLGGMGAAGWVFKLHQQKAAEALDKARREGMAQEKWKHDEDLRLTQSATALLCSDEETIGYTIQRRFSEFSNSPLHPQIEIRDGKAIQTYRQDVDISSLESSKELFYRAFEALGKRLVRPDVSIREEDDSKKTSLIFSKPEEAEIFWQLMLTEASSIGGSEMGKLEDEDWIAKDRWSSLRKYPEEYDIDKKVVGNADFFRRLAKQGPYRVKVEQEGSQVVISPDHQCKLGTRLCESLDHKQKEVDRFIYAFPYRVRQEQNAFRRYNKILPWVKNH